MALPQGLTLDQTQNTWATALDPVISNPLVKGNLLLNQKLVTGSNVINHKLGRKLIGWFVIGKNGVADIYDTQASNQLPQLTLNLTSSADVTASLWVF